jgi:hypothetical protein
MPSTAVLASSIVFNLSDTPCTATLVFAMIFALSAVASLIAARWDD